jgi:predicted TIM-barrel fold metal-dependent hydrolase
MAREVPRTNIIVAHLGRYLCKEESLIDRFIGLAEEHNNVLLDASGVVITSKIREAVERIGSGRVIFGTDGPHKVPDTMTYARTELDKIRALNLDPRDEAAVLGGTIADLLGVG